MDREGTIRLEFNGRPARAPAGVTVLRAAELNGVFIPTLCSHKDLSPFGGCRLCIVEIEGFRGYPLACCTEAAEGMRILTETVAIQEMRREVLQLILSEHPSSCLICSEQDECRRFMGTVRKAGVTTGCRYCPNDEQCELQALVRRFEITEIKYPILYRNLPAERQDPFYDRDYNLCILCGRCVRMCQEMRGTSVLAFTFRGSRAVVGPAFGRSHVEAGCEFCGACVAVCPTGALAEKASKWEGKPDGSQPSTCPFCAIGCRLDLHHKNGRFVMALPVTDSEVNDGQACVKGRFCMGEVSHHFSRARKPFARENGGWKEKDWEQALEIAAGRLGDLSPGEFAMLVSPDATNEDLYVAQEFARVVMGTNAVDCTARRGLGGGLDLWLRLFGREISIQGIRAATRIIAIGLDTRFNFSVVGVEIRKAMQRGARLVTIDPRESNLARYADVWLRPSPGYEGTILLALLKGTGAAWRRAAEVSGTDPERLADAAQWIQGRDDLTVIFGPAVFRCSYMADLVEAISILLGRERTNVLPLYSGANTRGAIEMGAFADLLPGGVRRRNPAAARRLEEHWGRRLPADSGMTLDEILSGAKRPRVLHLVGAHPTAHRPACDALIVQDLYEPDVPCDLFLPASSFLEAEGTRINVEGRVQPAPRLEILPDSVLYGRARPDWWILSRLAQRMGASGFEYERASDVLEEVRSVVPGFPGPGGTGSAARPLCRPSRARPKALAASLPPRDDGRMVLSLQPMGYTHRGIVLTSKVEGLQILDPECGFFMSPEDAHRLGCEEGERVTVRADGVQGSARLRIDPELQRGTIYLYVPEALGGAEAAPDLEELFHLKENPCLVEVTRDAV